MSEELVVLREALEDTYNKLKNAMAYTQNDAVYTMLSSSSLIFCNSSLISLM